MQRVGGVGACALRGRPVPRRLLRVDPRAWRAGVLRGSLGPWLKNFRFFLRKVVLTYIYVCRQIL